MASEQRHLVIFCGNFPFGFAEPFLEVELNYLKAHFQRITICTTALPASGNEPQFEVPEGVELLNIQPNPNLLEKTLSVFQMFTDEDIGQEMQVIREAYHNQTSWGRLKTMLVSKLRALRIKKFVEEKLLRADNQQIFLYSYWADDAALALTYIKRERPDVTAFCRIHGWDLYFERSPYFYLPFRKLIFNGLDAVFPISENGKNYLLSHFDTIINRGRVYPSRLGIRTVDALPEQNRKFRRFRLISCSNLIPIKRVELIIRALSFVRELEIDWTHFGDGSEHTNMRVLASQLLDGKENIEYHFPGRLPNWQVLKYYSDHTVDLFITLSRYDGIPVSIMEAMSFGIPALATDVGGVSEIVINGKTGFLLDQEVNPKDVAEVIEKVASMDAEKIDAMRAEAKNMWGTFYSADINYPEFCKKVLSLREG
ncbi:MAG: glycosyltransferase [Flavobacteriales bacterium]|nr:glycosyltransferase [Flavobacteriales bacterium]